MDDDTQVSVDTVNSSQGEMDVRKERRVASKKTNKPLIEKRRRARINECLQQLKEIIVRDRQLDNVRGNRLEKADILEMTVEYIRQLSHEGSPVSCLQSAYERGVERCVREMSEFMLSQRDVIDSSVTHKLTNHCRKMLGHHYPQADDVKSQLIGNKRTVPMATETMADSSTSPKRYRVDDDNECNVDITRERDSTCDHNQGRIETPKAVITLSPQSTSPAHVALHSSSMMSSLIKSNEVQTNSPNSPLPNLRLTVQSELVGSSKVEFPHDDCRDHVLTTSCQDFAAANLTNSPNKQTETSNHSTSPGVEKELTSLSIASTSITPPLSNFISKPVFFSCPGNVFILLDKPAGFPQPVLQNPLHGSVFPVEQNIFTLLPAPLTYKLPTSLTYTSNACTEIGMSQPTISSNCAQSISLQSMISPNQTAVSHFTSRSENPVSVLLNPGIIVKHEPANNTLLSMGQNAAVQYLLHSQDHQNVNRHLVQPAPQMFSPFQNASSQISENVQFNNSHIFQDVRVNNSQNSQNVQQESQSTVQHNQDKNSLHKTVSASGDTIPTVTHAPAGFMFFSLNNDTVAPGNKLLQIKLSEQQQLQENKILEHNLQVNKLNKIPEYKLPNYNLPEHTLTEQNVLEYKLQEFRLPEAASPKEDREASTISQTAKILETLKDKSFVESGNVCERCPQDFEDSPADLRLMPGDESCVSVPACSSLAAPEYKAPVSSEVFHTTWFCDASSNVLNSNASTPMNAATNKSTQYSPSQSDSRISDSSIESCVLYKSTSCMSRAVSGVYPSSSSDNQEMISRLQETNQVLDLSCKVPAISRCRTEVSDVDINNNSIGMTDLNSSHRHALPKPSLSVSTYNKTSSVTTDCISNLTDTPIVSNQAYTYKNALDSSLFSRTFSGFDQSSVWRPWGNNPELKELY